MDRGAYWATVHRVTKGQTRLSDFTFTYDYTVEVMIKSDRVPKELWMDVCNIVQEAVTKTIPKEKNCKKAKLSEEA